MAEIEASEPEIMRKIWGADEEFWVMMFSRHRRMAWSSAVNTDAVFRCLNMCVWPAIEKASPILPF